MAFFAEVFEEEVEDGSEIESEDLGDDEASDDDEAERDAGLGGHAAKAEGDRDGSHESGEGGHEDGAEPLAAGLFDSFQGSFTCEDGVIGKVDEDDAVFHDDAQEEDESDKGVERKGVVENEEGQKAS